MNILQGTEFYANLNFIIIWNEIPMAIIKVGINSFYQFILHTHDILDRSASIGRFVKDVSHEASVLKGNNNYGVAAFIAKWECKVEIELLKLCYLFFVLFKIDST